MGQTRRLSLAEGISNEIGLAKRVRFQQPHINIWIPPQIELPSIWKRKITNINHFTSNTVLTKSILKNSANSKSYVLAYIPQTHT